MIRFVHCVKRHSSLSPEEFRRYWNSREFSELLKELGGLIGARRVQRSLALVIDMNVELMKERGSAEPFDALLEVWLDNARTMEQQLDSPEFSRVLERMEAYQMQFIDFAASRRFFTDWEEEGEV